MMELILGSMIILGGLLILLLPIAIVYLIGLWKVFKKAGRKGWEAIVPFYNTWVLAEISGTAWWYALIIILSNLGIGDDAIIASIITLGAFVSNFFIFYNLSKKFHKGVGFAILMTLFPFIMIPIIGFSSSYQYDKDVKVSENGPIDDNNVNASYSEVKNENNDYTSKKYCQYCGKKINDDAKYCGNCGNVIEK